MCAGAVLDAVGSLKGLGVAYVDGRWRVKSALFQRYAYQLDVERHQDQHSSCVSAKFIAMFT